MPTRKKTPATGGTVRFALDGEIIALEGVDPTRTVLQYLREDLGRTGTKEGCAEGDCGACTVVVGELDGDGVRFRAINACIRFLPSLDGKELFTVECLKGADGALHPVQQAMVDCHGSQCGFCTPGFVMSLFGLYKTAALARRATRSTTRSPATCAAAPATGRSSTPRRRCTTTAATRTASTRTG